MDGDTSLSGGTASFLEGKLIDLTECLRDSPGFRAQLYEQERQISDLEARLDKVVMGCEKMVDASVSYTDTARFFTTSIKELSEHFMENPTIRHAMRQFCDVLPKLHSLYSVLCDQAHVTIQKSLKAFLSGNLSKVKETKKTFDRISEDLNTAVNRNAHTPKTKPQEAEEASVILANMETQFSHHAIDYGYQVNTIHCEKGHEVVHNLLTFMRAQSSFFSQGYDLFKEYDPFIAQLTSTAEALKKESCAEMDKMSKRHSLVVTQHLQDGSPDEPLLPMDNPAVPIEISGYLFKKGSSGFKSWSRRYFVLKEDQLVYHSRSKAVNDEDYNKTTFVTVADDLRICTVKYAEDQERRFCFEVVTPNKSCMLQADSDAQRKKWVAYLEAGVARALRISMSAKGERGSNRMSVMYGEMDSSLVRYRADSDGSTALANDYSLGLYFLEVPGNDKCADCSSPRPNWASINLGIMVCIKCSGIHRSLGVHISKVRSVTLDDWEPEVQKIMCALGNSRVNAIYEYNIPDYVKRPTPNSSRAERESFIKAKYADHSFVHPHPDFTRQEVPRPSPRRSVSPRFPSQFQRAISASCVVEGTVLAVNDSKPQGLSETSSVDPTLLLMSQNLVRMQGFGVERSPRLRTSTNLFSKFGGKIMNKAKGWKASLEKASPIIGRREMAAGGREDVGEMTVVEEGGEQTVVTNHLPSKKDLYDLECKGIPVGKSAPQPAEMAPGGMLAAESTQSLPTMAATNPPHPPIPLGVTPSPRSSPPPPKPPRTHKIRRSTSGRARIDCEHPGKLFAPSMNAAIEEGKAITTTTTTIAGDEVDSNAPNGTVAGVPPGSNEKIPCSLLSLVGSAPVASDATPTNGDPSRVLGVDVSAEGVVPEEGFEEAREIKVAFRDPSTLKRSLSLTDHRFSVLSEEWFSPNESDNDDESSLKAGKLLTEEDHFSTPPTSPEDSLIKELQGGGDDDDGGIVIVAHQGAGVSAAGVAMDAASEDHASSPTINVFLLPKVQDCPVEPPTISLHSKEGGTQTPPIERRLLNEGRIPTPPMRRMPIYGSAQTPPKNGRAQTPPKEGSAQVPPKEGSAQAPPKNGSAQAPPKEGSAQAPPKEGSAQTPPKEKAVPVLWSPMPPDQSAVPLPPRERAMEQLFPFVPSPGTKRASAHQFPVTQASPKTPRASIQAPPPLHVALQREMVERSSSAAPNYPTARTSPLSVEGCGQRVRGGLEEGGVAPPNPTTAVGQLGHIAASSPSIAKLSDSEDVFEDKQMTFPPIPPSGWNHPSDDTASLVSSFSVQDLNDIFKGHIPVPSLRIHSVDDSMIPNGSLDGSKKSPSGSGIIHGRLSQSTMDVTSLDGEMLETNSLERSPSVGTQPPEVETVVVPDLVHPDVFLFDAAHNGNLPAALCALVHGANVNYVSLENDCMTPMLEAVDTGNTTMTEFLYQNGGKVDVCDMSMKRGCLHHAIVKDDASMVVLLLKKCAPVSVTDVNGKDALALALERDNDNIMTLFKATKFKRKNDDTELEQTMAEVYKDIAVVTTTEPDKVKKLNGSDSHPTAMMIPNN